MAIIGGGLTGLCAALRLADKFHVDIYEKAPQIGGLAESFPLGGVWLEKYYHHIFTSDKLLIDLAAELGVADKLRFYDGPMGYFCDGKIYKFGTPQSLLAFSPLSMKDKIKFGLSILKLNAVSDWKSLEAVSAKDWLMEHAGAAAYSKIWEPLLKSKFGAVHETVSMAWMWGKIKLRGSSAKLGYMDGSYKTLTDALERRLKGLGCGVFTNSAVEKIAAGGGGGYVVNGKSYDCVLSTVAYPVFREIAADVLPESYLHRLGAIQYTGTRCMTLVLDRSFMPVYWLNVGDPDIPFGGLIEHTNMIDKSVYDGKNILYISNYMFTDDPLYPCSAEELFAAYLPHLKRINPAFDESWVLERHVYKDDHAQPVITRNYDPPGFETPAKGLFIAAMPQIYPEDRGMNYAVRLGFDAAGLLFHLDKTSTTHA